MNDLKVLAEKFTVISKRFNDGLIDRNEYLSKTIMLQEYLKNNNIPFEEIVKLTN